MTDIACQLTAFSVYDGEPAWSSRLPSSRTAARKSSAVVVTSSVVKRWISESGNWATYQAPSSGDQTRNAAGSDMDAVLPQRPVAGRGRRFAFPNHRDHLNLLLFTAAHALMVTRQGTLGNWAVYLEDGQPLRRRSTRPDHRPLVGPPPDCPPDCDTPPVRRQGPIWIWTGIASSPRSQRESLAFWMQTIFFAYLYVAQCRLTILLPAEIVSGCRWTSPGVGLRWLFVWLF
jgi:hypothetical protein